MPLSVFRPNLTENRYKFYVDSLFAADLEKLVAFGQQSSFPAFLYNSKNFTNQVLNSQNTKIVVMRMSVE